MEQSVVSRKDWHAARLALLARERELTHQLDQLKAARRSLPWVKVDENYVFDSVGGRKSLSDLFDGRSQLFVQHFMLTPGSSHICPGCAGMADGVDTARQHFEQADLSFAAVSRASVEEIEAAKRRLGWKFQWVSSGGNRFNADYEVSFTPEEVASGDVGYNFGTTPYAAADLPGISMFAKNEVDEIFHTYSAYSRGVETVFTSFSFLDFAPKGRNENGTMSWMKLHDEYAAPSPADSCCGPDL